MKDELAYIFIEAWETVLSSFSSRKLLTAEVAAEKNKLRLPDIFVMIGMVGDMDGRVFLSMDGKTGAQLASEMLGGMDVSGMEDEVVKSAVGELCNMIMGNACSGISRENRNVDITPPSILSSEEIGALGGDPALYISLMVEDLGVVDFDVSIQSA